MSSRSRSRTRLICLCEGVKGSHGKPTKCIDPSFIYRLIRELDPSWLRPWNGSNIVRINPYGSRGEVINALPQELASLRQVGSDATIMVSADCDDNMKAPQELVHQFWTRCEREGITKSEFNQVVFALPKDRLENWIEFLLSGSTNEAVEGPRVSIPEAVEAAKKLASLCLSGSQARLKLPESLEWSCKNWHAWKERME